MNPWVRQRVLLCWAQPGDDSVIGHSVSLRWDARLRLGDDRLVTGMSRLEQAALVQRRPLDIASLPPPLGASCRKSTLPVATLVMQVDARLTAFLIPRA